MTEPVPTPAPEGALAARIGFAAAAALLATVAGFEGYRAIAYRDLGGVPTACWGDTEGIEIGARYSRGECERRIERQALAAAEAVIACTPGIEQRRGPLIAASSLAYNIGARAWCRSTASARMRAGDWRGGCDALLMWAKVNGKKVRGLMIRRAREREICLEAGA